MVSKAFGSTQGCRLSTVMVRLFFIRSQSWWHLYCSLSSTWMMQFWREIVWMISQRLKPSCQVNSS
ncbi:hypothetical protein RchiOBHm_Chr5g0057261 [Rosa chinensis]|uniref:Uncharacterized protein n=1 Tax=Rosa chinensis TaxID=74649 RepID=A0A2P6QGV0_ROSCH|nr:hypothetical protein RchiOBHm_Chr5g0057261 [Rosa chinensis]